MSFRLKIVLGIIVIQALLLIILIAISLNFLRLSNEIELSKRASSVASMFSVTIKEDVEKGDLKALKKAAVVILAQPGIVYARVKSKGRVLAEVGDTEQLTRDFIEDFLIEDVDDGIFDVYDEVSERGQVFGRVELGVSTDVIDAIMDAARRQIATVAIIGMGFSVLMAIFLGNYFTRQLTSLRNAARSIASGNIGYQLYIKGDDELAQTANAFNTMSRKLALMYSEKQAALISSEQKALDLQDSERRIKAILNNAVDGIITIDEYGSVESFNPAAEKIFGYQAIDVVGGSINVLMAEEQSNKHDGYLEEYLRGGANKNIGKSREVVGLRSDGNEFPLEIDIGEVQIEGHYLFIGLVRDISERKKTDKALKDAQRASLESARNKFEFIADIGQEIRTPMNGVLSMINLLHGTGLTAKQQEYVDMIYESSSSLITVINDVLDFSKLASGSLSLESSRFDLAQTISNVCQQQKFIAGEKGIRLVYLIHGGLPTKFLGDPSRIRQILINLLDNAIKFTPDQGDIMVHVELVNEDESSAVLRFEVTDTGVGLSPKKQKLIFKDNIHEMDHDRKFVSSGLGIIIIKKLVEMMGGQIGVRSKLGSGSTFWFTLALEKQSKINQVDEMPYGELKGMKAMLVDNRDAWRGFLRSQLESIGVDVHDCSESKQGLVELRKASAEEQPFQCVIFDMVMPDMNGLELATMINDDDVITPLRMVMVATTGYRGDSEEVKRAGISGYLSAPTIPTQLYECLAAVMRLDEDDYSTLVTRHSLADTKAFHRYQVLVVSNEPNEQKFLLESLTDIGFRAHYASHIDDAIIAVRRHYYGCVLVCIEAGNNYNHEVVLQLRSYALEQGRTDFILLALLNDEDKGLADGLKEAGFDGSVVMPVSTNALKNEINGYL